VYWLCMSYPSYTGDINPVRANRESGDTKKASRPRKYTTI
jgi:hypothetical protein